MPKDLEIPEIDNRKDDGEGQAVDVSPGATHYEQTLHRIRADPELCHDGIFFGWAIDEYGNIHPRVAQYVRLHRCLSDQIMLEFE